MISAAIALLAVAAPPVPAQPQDARVALAKFAACMWNQQGYKIDKWLNEEISDESQGEHFVALINSSDCDIDAPAVSLKFKGTLIRGSFYELMYLKDFGNRSAVESFTDISPVSYAKVGSSNGLAGSKYQLSVALGDCTVRAAPAAARQLLLTKLASAQESAAIQSLVPFLSTCIPQGQQMNLTTSSIRGAIAESLYRLTQAKYAVAR